MSDEPEVVPVSTNGIALRVACAGPPGGRPVVLLHGFPETWETWRRQIAPLVEAGCRVLAPDQRGYGSSDKPPRVADYALDRLVADVLGLIDAQGWRGAALVGHDWGGIVAWWTALKHPDRVDRLAVLNAPHPVAFRRMLVSHPVQWLRSWYIVAFQVPGLPEAALRRDHWQPLRRFLRDTSRPGTFSEADLDRTQRAWSEPGAIRAMIHWYRAALRHPPQRVADPTIRVPTLILWGPRDRFLGREAAESSLRLCQSGRLEWIDGATHWVHHEEPERVGRLLTDFLAPPRDLP